MASRSSSKFTPQELVTGIFKILHSLESKAMGTNPKIKEDLRKVENAINSGATLKQVSEADLQNYKSIVENLLGKKIDTSKVDTSKFES